MDFKNVVAPFENLSDDELTLLKDMLYREEEKRLSAQINIGSLPKPTDDEIARYCSTHCGVSACVSYSERIGCGLGKAKKVFQHYTKV